LYSDRDSITGWIGDKFSKQPQKPEGDIFNRKTYNIKFLPSTSTCPSPHIGIEEHKFMGKTLQNALKTEISNLKNERGFYHETR
jgi:hypothetical protein